MIRKLLVCLPKISYIYYGENNTDYRRDAEWCVLYFDVPENSYIGYTSGKFYGKSGTTLNYLGYAPASTGVGVGFRYNINTSGVPDIWSNYPLGDYGDSFAAWITQMIVNASNQGSDIYNTGIDEICGPAGQGTTAIADSISFKIERIEENIFFAALDNFVETSTFVSNPCQVTTNAPASYLSDMLTDYKADFFQEGIQGFITDGHGYIIQPDGSTSGSNTQEITNLLPYAVVYDLGSGDNITFEKTNEAKKYAATGERDDDPEGDTGSGDKPDEDEAENDTDGGDEYNQPTISGLTCNGSNFYKIDSSGVQDLMDFFWTKFSDFEALALNVFTAQYSDLSQNICSLKFIPRNIPINVTLANIKLGKYTTEIEAYKLVQHAENTPILIGSLSKSDIFTYNNYLDYSPYTSAKLYLPMYGVVDLDINKFMSFGNMYVRLIVDLMTGQGSYTISYGTSATNSRLDVVYETQIGMDVTLGLMDTLDSQKKQIEAMAKAGTSLATAPVTGGAGIMMAGSSLACDISDPVKVIGSNTGSEKILLPWYCCLILEKNQPDVATKTYGRTVGYPCNRSYLIGTDLTAGYVKTVNAQYSTFTGTSAEYEEMVNLLNGGVYI